MAQALWEELAPGAVVWLSGELGTGKTTFAQALTGAAGATRASSPTYALVQEYDSPQGRIYHADCYRLRSPEEAVDLDLFAVAKGARLLVIEWPEHGGAFVPDPTVHLRLCYAKHPDRRRIERVR